MQSCYDLHDSDLKPSPASLFLSTVWNFLNHWNQRFSVQAVKLHIPAQWLHTCLSLACQLVIICATEWSVMPRHDITATLAELWHNNDCHVFVADAHLVCTIWVTDGMTWSKLWLTLSRKQVFLPPSLCLLAYHNADLFVTKMYANVRAPIDMFLSANKFYVNTFVFETGLLGTWRLLPESVQNLPDAPEAIGGASAAETMARCRLHLNLNRSSF